MTTTSSPTFVGKDEWLDARRKLLATEKAATRARDELAAERREMPWRLVEEDYEFDTAGGLRTLSDLFEDRSQLVVYHFMYEPSWDEGCPMCSFWADNFTGQGTRFHLARRDTTFACVSNASVEQIDTYKAKMSWDFPWYSAAGTAFGADFDVNRPDGETEWTYGAGTASTDTESLPGLSVFARTADGRVGLTYSTFARGLEALNLTYGLLDLTPAGRDETELAWPMAWVERSNVHKSAEPS